MVKNYLFSIVIPTFNRAVLLERCLNSLLQQTFINFEVIVCDDGSTDNSEEIVSKYKDELSIIYLREQNWGGPARPRNMGISVAKGDWICLLDSDDWWSPNKLESCLPFLNDFDIIYHNLYMYNLNGNMFGRKISGRKFSINITRDLIVNGNGIPNSSVVVRTELIRKINGFSENKKLIAVEDSDCWIRLSELTNRFKYIPKCLGYYWIGNNVSVSINQIEREQELFNCHIDKLNFIDQVFAQRNIDYKKARIYHKLGKFLYAKAFYLSSFDIMEFNRSIQSILLYVFATFKIRT